MSKQETLDITQPVDVTVENPAFLNQTAPFVISGLQYDEAQSYVQAVESTPVPKTRNVSALAVKATQQAPEASQDVLEGRRATITAKLYDLVNGTNMYGLLAEKRRDEKNLAIATRLGLISSTHCAKHEKAVAQLKRIV